MTELEAQALMQGGANIDAESSQEAGGAMMPGGALVMNDNQAAMEWVFLPELLAMVITTALPETAPAYTPESNLRFAEKFAAVAAKRGWSGSSSPEISLVIASIGFGAPAYLAYQIRKKATADAIAAQQAGRQSNEGAVDGNG